MFQFTAFAFRFPGMIRLQRTGLPHSDISGSKVICTSPKLFAAYHVLLRLWEPRHPPCALNNFLSYLFINCTRLYSSTLVEQPMSFTSSPSLLRQFLFFQHVKELTQFQITDCGSRILSLLSNYLYLISICVKFRIRTAYLPFASGKLLPLSLFNCKSIKNLIWFYTLNR